MTDFNAQNINEFRTDDGVVVGQMEGTTTPTFDPHRNPLVTAGSKSGFERPNPAVCRVEGDDVSLFGSKTDASTNSDWFPSLVTNRPAITELGSETFGTTSKVHARGNATGFMPLRPASTLASLGAN